MMELEEGSGTKESDADLLEKARCIENLEDCKRYHKYWCMFSRYYVLLPGFMKALYLTILSFLLYLCLLT